MECQSMAAAFGRFRNLDMETRIHQHLDEGAHAFRDFSRDPRDIRSGPVKSG